MNPNDTTVIEFNYPELFEMKNEKEFSKSKTPGSPFIKDGQPHLGQSNEIVRDSERMLVELLRTKELWSVGGDSVTSSPRSGLLGLFMTGLYDNNHVLIKKFDRTLDLLGFYSEVYVSRKLSPCPYFLKFLRANDQDAPFIVYEYFEGKDLIEELPSIRPGHEYCLAYYIADAMKNLASVGLTILNLSPKNIVLRKHENGCYQLKLIPIEGAFVPLDLSASMDGSVSPTSPTSKPPSQNDLTAFGQLVLGILRREWPLRSFDVASNGQSPRYHHLVSIAQYCLSTRSATDRTSFDDILKRLAG
jgi:serine/threonine protein kinase